VTIQTFIKQKLKERGMRVDTFINQCGVSKSTIYRVMKGYQCPSVELENRIGDVLSFSPMERQLMRYYAALPKTEVDAIPCWEEIDRFLRTPREPLAPPVELVHYDGGEQYMRTLDRLLEGILAVRDQPGFALSIRLVNCCDTAIISALQRMLIDLSPQVVQIEHLVQFAQGNRPENIHMIRALVDMMRIPGYRAYYSAHSGASASTPFANMILLNYGCEAREQHMLCVCCYSQSLSTCLTLDQEAQRDFFERGYQAIRGDYTNALNPYSALMDNEALYLNLETQYNIYTLKHGPSFIRVPIPVFRHLVNRTPREDQLPIIRGMHKNEFAQEELENRLEALLSFMQMRMDVSMARADVDVYNSKGLEAFVRSGMLSDHFQGFPPFNLEERKAILTFIRNRHKDPNDPFRFHILKEEGIREDMIVVTYKGYGVQVMADAAAYRNYDFSNYILTHKELANIFCEFIENYVPNILAMTDEEAGTYLDHLIAQCD